MNSGWCWEIEPWRWSERATPPVGPSRRFRSEWDRYFRQCMDDAQIRGIVPIQPGSHFVDAFSVVQNDLMPRIIGKELEGSGFPGFPGEEDTAPEATALDAGFAVMCDDRVLLEPGCCCDFSNLESWERALRDRPERGTLWMGHPQVDISFSGEHVTVREGWEWKKPPEYDLAEFTVAEADLRQAVARAAMRRIDFAELLVGRVLELVHDASLARGVCSQLMHLGPITRRSKGFLRARLRRTHAMLANSRYVQRPGGNFAAALAHHGIRVFVLDWRGHGASKPPHARAHAWGFDDYLERDLPAAWAYDENEPAS